MVDCPVTDSGKTTEKAMSVTIAIVGCLDTKGEEMGYLRDVVEAPDYRYRDAHGLSRGLAAIGSRAIYHLRPVREKGSSAWM